MLFSTGNSDFFSGAVLSDKVYAIRAIVMATHTAEIFSLFYFLTKAVNACE